jgi:hypothetical protein
MITTIDKETIDFLGKKKLTFNQFCICLILYELLDNPQTGVAKVLQYTEEVAYLTGGTVMKPDKSKVNELEDLVDRGFVRYNFVDKTDKYSLDNYTVTDKFTKGFLDNFKTYAKELWAVYPSKMWIQGEAKDVAKVYIYEEFEEDYTRILKTDINHHQKAVAAVKQMKAKTGGYAEINLKNFIGSRHWNNIVTEDEQRVRPRFL